MPAVVVLRGVGIVARLVEGIVLHHLLLHHCLLDARVEVGIFSAELCGDEVGFVLVHLGNLVDFGKAVDIKSD